MCSGNLIYHYFIEFINLFTEFIKAIKFIKTVNFMYFIMIVMASFQLYFFVLLSYALNI